MTFVNYANLWTCEMAFEDTWTWEEVFERIRESGRKYLRICIFENLWCHACETIMTCIQCVNLQNWIMELRNYNVQYCIEFVICISAFSWVCDFVVEEMEWIAYLWFREFGMSCLWDNHDLRAVCEVVNLGKCSWGTTLRNPGFTLFETRLAGIDVFRSLSLRLHDFEQSRWFVNNKELPESVFWRNRICDVFWFELAIFRGTKIARTAGWAELFLFWKLSTFVSNYLGQVSTSSSWWMWFVS